MSDTEKLQGWFMQAGQEGTRVVRRWLRAVDMLGAGTYEPKHALADWYFYASRWLAFLPQAPDRAGLALPLLSLLVHAGQDTAAGTLTIPKAGGAAIAAALTEATDNTRAIAKANVTAALHDGGTTLLVTAKGLSSLGLQAFETYKGHVVDGGTTIANVELDVLGALT